MTDLIALLRERGLTIAVAESLTGGLLIAELIATPGASQVVAGGIVAYQTELKHALLGVDAALLAAHGPVHPEVAAQLATGARDRLTVGGRAATLGISTTGVAGPDPQGDEPVGTVYLGFALPDRVEVRRLSLTGDREAIRRGAVSESLSTLVGLLG